MIDISPWPFVPECFHEIVRVLTREHGFPADVREIIPALETSLR